MRTITKTALEVEKDKYILMCDQMLDIRCYVRLRNGRTIMWHAPILGINDSDRCAFAQGLEQDIKVEHEVGANELTMYWSPFGLCVY